MSANDNKAAADTTTGSNSSGDDEDIQLIGPQTLRDVCDNFLAEQFDGRVPQNAQITNLIIGKKGFPMPYQNLEDHQLDMQFVEFINTYVINAAPESQRPRIKQLLVDGPNRISLIFTVNDGRQGAVDETVFCNYKMDGLHFNKKIPKYKGQRRKPHKFLLTFNLEPIDEAG